MANPQAQARKTSSEASVRPAKPTRGRPVSEAMGDRRGRLLEIAKHCFAELGFEATSVRRIADAGNILSGSLYYHFTTKDEMLHEIVRDTSLRMQDESLRIAAAEGDAELRLTALILLNIEDMVRNRDEHAILYNERKFFRRSEEFHYVALAKRAAYSAWVEILQAGIDTGLFDPAIDIFLTISTTMRMLNTASDWFTYEDYNNSTVKNYDLDKLIDFYLRFLLRTVRNPARISDPIPRAEAKALVSANGPDQAIDN